MFEIGSNNWAVAGTHTAMVRGPAGEEIHTDKYGRCRVQLHWDREAVGTDEDSRWVRKCQESATSMNLGLDDPQVAAEFLGSFDGSIWRIRRNATRHGNAVVREQSL